MFKSSTAGGTAFAGIETKLSGGAPDDPGLPATMRKAVRFMLAGAAITAVFAVFEIIATMADDPDGYRSGMRKKLLELADTMPLSPMAAAREKKVRGFVKETVGNLLINQWPH